MKIQIELFGASRDFSDHNFLEFDIENNSTIKDIRNKIVEYLDTKFKGNENFKKIFSKLFLFDDFGIVIFDY